MPAIRRGRAEDLVAIAEIQAASPEAAQWKPEDYLAQLLLVATAGAGVVGFVAARPVADREFEILNLAVVPDFRRRGIARELLRVLFQDYHGTFYLEVRESNQDAQMCYKSLGFQQVTRRPGYYESPPEAAIVMKFHSC
jgi:ribosomal-protein-alanine acetyltransferase